MKGDIKNELQVEANKVKDKEEYYVVAPLSDDTVNYITKMQAKNKTR